MSVQDIHCMDNETHTLNKCNYDSGRRYRFILIPMDAEGSGHFNIWTCKVLGL